MADATHRQSGRPLAANVNTLWSHALVDELQRCGLTDVIISPGSRSAPLAFAFHAHPAITDHSIIDERSAAFFALGLACVQRKPVALVCTSGTATANFMPAVCEADAAGVPLLVLTADRLADDHDCGTQQVMDQTRLYGQRVRWFHHLAQPEASADKLAYVRSLACRAMHLAQTPEPGPVHLNLPFRKPLEPVQLPSGHRDHVPEALLREAVLPVHGRPDGCPWSKLYMSASPASAATVSRLCELVDRASRPLVLAGADAVTTVERDALRDFAALRNIPLLAEPTSGLRHWSARGDHVIAAADSIIESGFYQQHGWPDVLIRLGRAPLLWTTQGMLQQLQTHCHHVQIGRSMRRADPFHQLAEQIVCDPAELFAAASAQAIAPPLSATRRRWLQAHQMAQQQGLSALQAGLAAASGELSAPGLWHEIGAVLPDDAAVFVASSMAVRNLDSFMCMHANDLQVYFNAGLNGIDGIVSTAMGVAAARLSGANLPAMPTVLVIGDVALRHDVGALLLAAELGIDLTVIVIDNNGGEIFEYLPSAGYGAVHDKHFATVDRTATSGMLPHAVELHTVTGWAQFRALLKDCLESPGLHVVRLPTRRINDRRLRDALRQQAAAAMTTATPVSH